MTDRLFCVALGYRQMEEYMSVISHINELQKKHDELSLKVEKAQKSPRLDDFSVVAMKKQKLRLKEEIFRLSS